MSWKFVVDKRRPVYASLGAELAAIARGVKAISFFASDREGLADDLEELQPAALKRGLALTIAPRGNVIDIFVHRVAAAARIAKLQALLARTPWTFADEAALGVVLGYSAAQRAAWLAAERFARPAFGVAVVYGSAPHGEWPTTWSTQPGRIPARRGPRGLVLFRAGLSRAVGGASLLQVERLRRTPIERLGPTGWR